MNILLFQAQSELSSSIKGAVIGLATVVISLKEIKSSTTVDVIMMPQHFVAYVIKNQDSI